MKNRNFTFFLATCALALQTQCQEDKMAPKAVQETFTQMYPGENDPDWHLDANGNYEANFKQKGLKYRADYLPDGSWIETERSIEKKELPKIVRDRIEKEYDDEKITEIEEVRHATKGLFYDVEFKRKGKNKDVEFTADGRIINEPVDSQK